MLPPFNEHGLLPAGVHDCPLEEVEARFGSFQRSDRRPQLWAKFRDFLHEAKATGLVAAVLLNGSFVTAKPDPNDIDLILVVAATHDFTRDLSAAEYNVLSAQRVKQRHRLDVLVALENSDQYRRYLRLFEQVRLEPDQIKGIIRIKL
ncbi:MAG: hypothetical protein HY735_07850 [Verrucomicrobia bacterium]|nr:hypothetical protein [Verrucomicrobiota bacterium]